jgi:lipid-A-disaccharide synthase-like uncharacterized protein
MVLRVMRLSPASCELAVGVPVQFRLVDDSGTPVVAPSGTVWTTDPPGAGDMSSDGVFVARQLSCPDVIISASGARAAIHIVRPAVAVFPARVRLRAGERQRFQAVVTGDPAHGVLWSAAPHGDAMIDGEFAAPEWLAERQTVAVTAIFPGDPSITASATVEMVPEPTDWVVVWMLLTYLTAVFSLVGLLASVWPAGNASDASLLRTVLITGALGSFVYSARSFVDFVGNRKFRRSWIPWYLMYPMIGSALALVFYLAVRGGLLTTAAKGSDINIYGMAAIAGLSGMFSKQATNKLNELFTAMFRTETHDNALRDKLDMNHGA